MGKVKQNLAKINPDLDNTKRFLSLLAPKAKNFTFQVFADSDDKSGSILPRILHGTLDEHADELTRLNQKGAGIFVTLNETDGKGRKAENIISIRAVFLDLDGADVEPVKEFKPKTTFTSENFKESLPRLLVSARFSL